MRLLISFAMLGWVLAVLGLVLVAAELIQLGAAVFLLGFIGVGVAVICLWVTHP